MRYRLYSYDVTEDLYIHSKGRKLNRNINGKSKNERMSMNAPTKHDTRSLIGWTMSRDMAQLITISLLICVTYKEICRREILWLLLWNVNFSYRWSWLYQKRKGNHPFQQGDKFPQRRIKQTVLRLKKRLRRPWKNDAMIDGHPCPSRPSLTIIYNICHKNIEAHRLFSPFPNKHLSDS